MSRPLYEHTQAGWPMRIQDDQLQVRFGLGLPRKTFLEGWGLRRTRRG